MVQLINNSNFLITISILCILVFILLEYSINIKKPYPSWVVKHFQEPYIRFMSYFFIYLLACVNPLISLLCMFVVVFIHIDFINLVLV